MVGRVVVISGVVVVDEVVMVVDGVVGGGIVVVGGVIMVVVGVGGGVGIALVEMVEVGDAIEGDAGGGVETAAVVVVRSSASLSPSGVGSLSRIDELAAAIGLD